jgi:hypothetical protein
MRLMVFGAWKSIVPGIGIEKINARDLSGGAKEWGSRCPFPESPGHANFRSVLQSDQMSQVVCSRCLFVERRPAVLFMYWRDWISRFCEGVETHAVNKQLAGECLPA